MGDLVVTWEYVEDLAGVLLTASENVHLPAAATTSGVSGLESPSAIAALDESTRERVQRSHLAKDELEKFWKATRDVGVKLRETDASVAGSAPKP